MQVLDPNDVKIYNLSCGKSVPEWISDRKKRRLKNKDVDLRRRIELIQDFDMPILSTSIKLSKDNHYIMATGIYKPRLKCFEFDNLSLKFERCFDSEVVTFEMLSQDYSKLAFLHNDRYVELHSTGGRYYKFRIPKYGRDMKYHYATCDLLIGGVSSDLYRMNLERGQFLEPWSLAGSEVNKIAINPCHRLVVAGTKEGKVEAWDPRAKERVSSLDVALHCVTQLSDTIEGFPSISSLEFDGALTLGVGVATGQVLLYDIRSNKPSIVKDHLYNLPIKDIAFINNKVLSMDSAVVKIWDSSSGKLMTFIESGKNTLFNNLCLVPNTGLMFIANEHEKILSYYIPSLAPAPPWCSFLDNLTEELEESKQETVYDDFKFVTKSELADLGLGHLLGTSMAKAYMHGYFVDVRLWRKAKEASEPFKYEEYKKKKLKEKMEAERPNRVQLEKLPKINRELALKLMDEERRPKKKGKFINSNLLHDDRFQALFSNPDFQVNTSSEEYRLLNPVVSRLDAVRKKELQKEVLKEKFFLVEDDDAKKSSDDDILNDSSEESSDDEKEWAAEVRKEHKAIRKEQQEKERLREKEKDEMEAAERVKSSNNVKMYQLKSGVQYSGIKSLSSMGSNRISLGERIASETDTVVSNARGNREITFSMNKGKFKKNDPRVQMLKHKLERKRVARKVPQSISRTKFNWTKRR